MFNLFKGTTYRAQWNIIKNCPLFNPSSTQNLQLNTLIKNLSHILNSYTKGSKIKIFQILTQSTSNNPIKVLQLIHLLLQTIEKNKIRLNLSTIIQEINRVINDTTQAEQEYNIIRKIKKLNKIQQQMQQNEDKQIQNKVAKTEIANKQKYLQKLTLKSQKEIDICMTAQSTPIPQRNQPFQIIVSRQLVKPYASFLLKYVSFLSSHGDLKENQLHKIWSYINLLKSLLKVGSNFSSISSTFQTKSKKDILQMTQIFSFNIDMIYKDIRVIVKEKLEIMEQRYKNYHKQLVQKEILEKKRRKMIQKMQLDLLKQAIEEIMTINKQIDDFYHCDVVGKQLEDNGFYPPQTLHKSDQCIQLLYKVLDEPKQQKIDHGRSLRKRNSLNPQCVFEGIWNENRKTTSAQRVNKSLKSVKLLTIIHN